MRKDAESHAEDDLQRKELIEARNLADNAVYTAEKTVRDLGDKIPAEMVEKVESETAKVREVLTSEDPTVIREATDGLMSVVQELGAAAYQQSEPEAGAGEGEPGAEAGTDEGAPESEENGEDVVEGEFKEEAEEAEEAEEE